MRASRNGLYRRLAGFASSIAVLTLLFGGATGVGADAAHGHPARLHEGACEAVGPVAFQLNGAGATLTVDDSTPPAADVTGAESAVAIEASVTAIEAPLADVVAGGHAINVYLSDEAMETVIACGDVGGPTVDGTLVVGLREVGDSGYAGVALLREEAGGTIVTILLGAGAAGEATGDDHADDHADEAEHEDGDDHGHDAAEGTPAA